ncbi:TetR/AcrR family transcriptional regulator, partial [Pseudofrankia saprophytica]
MATGTSKGTAARRLLAGLTAPTAGTPVIRPVGRHGAAAPAERGQPAGGAALPGEPGGAGEAGDLDEAVPGGLRELKKQRTRRTIVDTAHALFAQYGYDATTIDAIAVSAEVSVRTFFRYFANKEEVALAPLDEVGELALAALERRPAHERPLAALRAASLDAWAAMGPRPAAFRGYVEHLLIADSAPAVSAAMLQRMMRLGDRLAAAITPRFPPPTGPAPGRGADLRPTLTAAAFLAAVQVGVRSWFTQGGQDLDEMLAMVEYCIDQLVPADQAHPTSERPEPVRPAPAGAARCPTPVPTAAQ